MDLQGLRGEIDAVDAELVRLFVRRMEIVRQIAQHKIENGIPVYHPEREQQVVDKARERAGADLSGYAERYFQSMMEISRSMQEDLLQDNTPKKD